MKVVLEISPDDSEEDLQKVKKIVDILNESKGQQNLNESNSEKKVLCDNCKKDFYELYEPDEAQKVISYSNTKIGKALCRDCQKKHWENRGGDA